MPKKANRTHPNTEVKMVEKKQIPSQDQINEVIDPTLSKDDFTLLGKKFPIRILPISYEKKMALALGPVMDLIGEFKDKPWTEVLANAGASKIAQCMDVMVDVVCIICSKYDADITREAISESDDAHASTLLPIVMAQLNKQGIGDLVSSFFLLAAQRMAALMAKNPASPPNLES